MSHGTWDKVEERRKMKEKVNNARTRLRNKKHKTNTSSSTKKPEPDQPLRVEPAGEDLYIKIDNIKKYEVKKAIKSIKNRKSAGIDEIPPEAFKSRGNEIIEYMYKLLNKIWQEEKIPTEWLKVFLLATCYLLMLWIWEIGYNYIILGYSRNIDF
ncbi:unnamed protein product [Mytilus coruscus]|uniref:Reverse transcriptase domain-containing protein n=1 Tax=Mytilus coruscus TaxID=42192 RepID=A0A6J8C067_MYTCO|nr:unnamed protein product [Mytilus coruscus]